MALFVSALKRVHLLQMLFNLGRTPEGLNIHISSGAGRQGVVSYTVLISLVICRGQVGRNAPPGRASPTRGPKKHGAVKGGRGRDAQGPCGGHVHASWPWSFDGIGYTRCWRVPRG